MKNTNDFCYNGKSSRVTTKSTLFAVSQDKWDTKEDTGKSMKMHCMYCGMAAPLKAKVMSNSDKIKAVPIAVIELHLSEDIS